MGNQEKHELQLNALVSTISQVSSDNIVGIEIGAGKGTLSAAVHQKNHSFKHLLVDIQKNFRNKAENKMTTGDTSVFHRIHMDIADLHLDKALQSIYSNIYDNMEIIIFAKHLCGLALDKALLCITNTIP